MLTFALALGIDLTVGLTIPATSAKRRVVLRDSLAAAGAFGAVLPCFAAGSLESVYDSRGLDMAPVVDPKQFQRTPSGARYADLKVGNGPEVTAGSRVSLQWVLRRSNGYFVDCLDLGTCNR